MGLVVRTQKSKGVGRTFLNEGGGMELAQSRPAGMRSLSPIESVEVFWAKTLQV